MSQRSLWVVLPFSLLGWQVQLGAAAAQEQFDVEVRAAIVTEDLQVHPLPQVAFRILSPGQTPVDFVTDLYGLYTTTLPAGSYTVQSKEGVEFQGSVYSWNISFTVSGNVVLELTQANATISDGPAEGGQKGQAGQVNPSASPPGRAVQEGGVQAPKGGLENVAGQLERRDLPPATGSVVQAIAGWRDERIGVSPIDFPGKVIARLPVPEGSYVIIAKMEVSPHVDTNGSVGCRLIAGGDSDQAQESWGKPSVTEPGLAPWNPLTIALNVVHTYSRPGDVLLQCWGRTARATDGVEYFFDVSNIKITAMKVAHLENGPLELVE